MSRLNVGPTFNGIEDMSNLQILDALDALLEEQGDSADESTLLAYLDALDERAPMPEDVDPEATYDDFVERYSHLELEKVESPPRARRRKWMRPVIVAAALVAILAMSVAADIYEIDVFDDVASWVGQVFKTGEDSGEMSLKTPNESGYQSIEAAASEHRLTHAVPTWIPTRFSIADLMVHEMDGFVECIGVYHSNSGEELVIVMDIMLAPSPSTLEMIPDTEDIVVHNDQQFAIIDNTRVLSIYWGTQNYACNVYGSIDRDEAVQIIKSIGD